LSSLPFFMARNDWLHILVLSSAILVSIIIIFFIGFVFYTAFPTFQSQGLYFLIGQTWSYDEQVFGALNFIVGTLSLTLVTLLLAVPIGLLAAIFMAEYSPEWFSSISRPLIELLFGIPSVVYGIFGLFILEPVYKDYLNPFIDGTFGFIPVFRDVAGGNGIFLASSVLAVMILPTIVALSEEAVRSVPREYKDASMALGATRWETTRKIVLSVALSGIVAGIVIGMMRAMGETMAIIMLMGNSPHIPTSILDSACTMTANIYASAEYRLADPVDRSPVFAMAAALFLAEMILAAIAQG